jgi:hypothetical protein
MTGIDDARDHVLYSKGSIFAGTWRFSTSCQATTARRRAEHTILAQGAVPSREAPLNDLPGSVSEFGLMLAISRMEVRRRMVSVVHGDDNTEETG